MTIEAARERDEQARIQAISVLCRQAVDRLGPRPPFRLRVLLDMVLIELDRETQRLSPERSPIRDGQAAKVSRGL